MGFYGRLLEVVFTLAVQNHWAVCLSMRQPPGAVFSMNAKSLGFERLNTTYEERPIHEQKKEIDTSKNKTIRVLLSSFEGQQSVGIHHI